MTWLLLQGAVMAGIPVVSDGEEVLELVSQRTGLPLSQLDPVSVTELLEIPPRALGDAVIRHCAGEPVRMVDVRTEQVRAAAAWSRGDTLAAMDHLDVAVARLSCLSELVDPEVVAGLFLLRGGLLAHAGEEAAAAQELDSALAFDATVAWHDRYPVAGESLLVAARARRSDITITVYPPGGSSGPWIDGRIVKGELAVRSGLHLVQSASTAGIRSAWLVVGSDAALVVPSSYRRTVLSTMTDPAQHTRVAALLQATLPGMSAAYVASGGGLWLITIEGASPHTTELIAPPPPEPSEPERWRLWDWLRR